MRCGRHRAIRVDAIDRVERRSGVDHGNRSQTLADLARGVLDGLSTAFADGVAQQADGCRDHWRRRVRVELGGDRPRRSGTAVRAGDGRRSRHVVHVPDPAIGRPEHELAHDSDDLHRRVTLTWEGV
jgi:hypothetical protein